MKKVILCAVMCLMFGGCSYSNLEEVKQNACGKWAEVGYECVGYEGYGIGLGFWNYGGAQVWHTLKRKEAPGIIYTGHIIKWGDEYHVYGPEAVDAIKGK